MGFFAKLAGKPEQPRKAASKREGRAAERHAMRSSRDSSNWGLTSPAGSMTDKWQHHYGPVQQGHPPMYAPGPLQLGRTSAQPRISSPPPAGTAREQGVLQRWKEAVSPRSRSNVPMQHSASTVHQSSATHHAKPQMPGTGEIQAMNAPLQQQQPYDQAATGYLPLAPQGNQSQPEQVRELQRKVQVLEAQVGEVEGLKQRLLAEQRTAVEWKEKWNMQNFKLHLMVDMLALQALENESFTIPAVMAK